MRYDWIEIAMENGGFMTTFKDNEGFKADMDWSGDKFVAGEYRSTLPEAITSLNSELEDDAANECQC